MDGWMDRRTEVSPVACTWPARMPLALARKTHRASASKKCSYHGATITFLLYCVAVSVTATRGRKLLLNNTYIALVGGEKSVRCIWSSKVLINQLVAVLTRTLNTLAILEICNPANFVMSLNINRPSMSHFFLFLSVSFCFCFLTLADKREATLSRSTQHLYHTAVLPGSYSLSGRKWWRRC